MRLCPACRAPLPEGLTCRACGHRIEIRDGFELLAPQAEPGMGGYNPAYYAELAELEDENFWFQARNKLIVRTLRKCFPNLQSFLEIGCGTGQVLRAIDAAFPATRLTGSELFAKGLTFARQRVATAHLMQMDATAIPYASEFDVIGAFDVIEHIDDDVKVLSEIHRALRPGGGAIFTVPQHPWLWSHQDEMAHHVRRYRRHELEHKLESKGFRVVCTTSFVSLLLPVLLLSRRSRTANSVDPFRELRIGKGLNKLLSAVMTIESGLIRTRIPLPIGGSRLAVVIKPA